MDSELFQSLRKQHSKPHEQTILDWAERSGIDNLVFYPSGHPTILATWASPDPSGRELFREVDIIVEHADHVRVSGGAMYHAPTYHLAWLPAVYGTLDDLPQVLVEIKQRVDKLTFDDMTDMDAYLGVMISTVEL